MLVGSAQAVTIEAMWLYGGNGDSLTNWGGGNGQIWNTVPVDGIWALGVSSAPGGPLLNASNTSISGLPFGNYYLYAEPTDLGKNPLLKVYLSDSTISYTLFMLDGSNGSGTPWISWDGDLAITLGWANGTANLVVGESVTPGGANDFYLKAGIYAGTAPLPGAVLALRLWSSGHGGVKEVQEELISHSIVSTNQGKVAYRALPFSRLVALAHHLPDQIFCKISIN